jgi:2-(1,2-epoxy-1,2-dihydrophenyl)acetyl-CoA isomerase
MTNESPILLERRGALAVLTLNRPTVGNAIDVPLARALMDAALACDEDDSIRCVLLTGAGRMFCAGGDVGGFAKAGDNAGALVKEITGYLHVAISRLSRMGKPLVCAINGPAAGAGFPLALLGDLVIAAKSAHFTLAYTAIGLTPDGSSTWLLPRLVGLRLTQELVLTNRRVAAEEAVTLGLITRVVDDAELASEAEKLAATLAAGATQAFGAARRLLLQSFESSLETQMERESRTIGEAARSAHGREGIAAFLGKRKPEFK